MEQKNYMTSFLRSCAYKLAEFIIWLCICWIVLLVMIPACLYWVVSGGYRRTESH